MYRVACGLRERGGWELRPVDFWEMSPREWWLIFEINVGSGIRESEETKERLKRLYYQSRGER